MHNLHVFGNVGEDGWLDEIALLAVTLSTNLNLRTVLLPGVDVAKRHLVSVYLKNRWAKIEHSFTS